MLAKFMGSQLRGGQDNPFEGGLNASAQGEQNINRQTGQGRIASLYSRCVLALLSLKQPGWQGTGRVYRHMALEALYSCSRLSWAQSGSVHL